MRTGGRALVETTLSLDIRPLVRAGAIRDDVHADGKMTFGSRVDALTIAFEVSRKWLDAGARHHHRLVVRQAARHRG